MTVARDLVFKQFLAIHIWPNSSYSFACHTHDEINELCRLTNGASVRLTGKLTESPGAGQDHELQVDAVEVLGECDPDVSSHCI